MSPWREGPDANVGEVAGVFFDGTFSHGLRRVPPPHEFRVNLQYGGRLEAATLSDATIRQDRQRAPARARAPALRARVDEVLRSGRFLLMEVEVNEPGLGLHLAPGAGERFAAAFHVAAGRCAGRKHKEVDAYPSQAAARSPGAPGPRRLPPARPPAPPPAVPPGWPIASCQPCPFRLIDRAVRMTGCVRSSSALSLWLRRTPRGDQVFRGGVQTQGGGRARRTALTSRPATSERRKDLTPPRVCTDDAGLRPWVSRRSRLGRDASRISAPGRPCRGRGAFGHGGSR